MYLAPLVAGRRLWVAFFADHVSRFRRRNVSSVRLEGYLHKQGGFFKSWLQRWFIVGLTGFVYLDSDDCRLRLLRMGLDPPLLNMAAGDRWAPIWYDDFKECGGKGVVNLTKAKVKRVGAFDGRPCVISVQTRTPYHSEDRTYYLDVPEKDVDAWLEHLRAAAAHANALRSELPMEPDDEPPAFTSTRMLLLMQEAHFRLGAQGP